MRGRLSFALTACTLLFLLDGLAALLATSYATVHQATTTAALVPLALPLLALAAPMVPITRLVGRYNAVAGTAVIAAVARVPLCVPDWEYRVLASAVVVAAGASFLSCAVGFLERRSVAAGVGAAITLDQLLRLAGWSWSVALQPAWLWPQIVVSGAVVALAVQWLRMAAPDEETGEGSFERRAGGLRLRGGLALGFILFLDLNVLARAEVAARWLDVRYEAAAVLLVTAGAAATLVLLAGHGPLGRGRAASAALAVAATTAVLAARPLAGLGGGWPGLVLMAAGHAAAVLLIGRALVPASGRRKGSTTTAALVVWLAATALYSATFFPALPVSRPWLAPALFAAAGAGLVLFLVALPRPLATLPPLRRRLYTALGLVAAVSAAALLAVRERPARPDAPAGDTVRVAGWNVRLGFDAAWRYDPAAIVRAIRAADADVVALHDVAAGLPLAYGTDLGLYLGRRLGLRLHFVPARNGLHGAAVLTRVGVAAFRSAPLPSRGAAPQRLATLLIPAGGDTLRVHLTRSPAADRAGGAALLALLRAVDDSGAAVLMVDPALDDDVTQRLRGMGFHDAFTPADAVDGILVRGALVSDVATAAGVAFGYPLRSVTLRLR
jgi:hypothetical protein